jgi:hypothetical protein
MSKEYLGDGVYAERSQFGDIVISTHNGVSQTNTVVCEPEVAARLVDFLKRHGFIAVAAAMLAGCAAKHVAISAALPGAPTAPVHCSAVQVKAPSVLYSHTGKKLATLESGQWICEAVAGPVRFK